MLREVVSGVLTAGGLSAAGPDAARDQVGRVTVLVDPGFADWKAAKADGAPIVLFTTPVLREEAVLEAVVRGADAVLHGDCGPEEMLRAALVVAEGGTALSPDRVRALADLLRGCDRPGRSVVRRLTPREVDILTSIDRGESVKQTARAIGISTKTVENLQTRMFRKLGVRNRAQAIMRAHSAGLVPPNPEASTGG